MMGFSALRRLIGRRENKNPRGKLQVLSFSQKAQSDVTGLLRNMLQRAEAGQIRAVAVAAHSGRGDTGSAYALGDGDIAHLVCAIERVKLRLLEEE
jgi:hypothetical protein